jgi:hypothetical protein
MQCRGEEHQQHVLGSEVVGQLAGALPAPCMATSQQLSSTIC